GAVRSAAGDAPPGAVTQALIYAADGREAQPVAGGGLIVTGDAGAAQVAVVDRRRWPARPVAVRAALRPVAFRALDLGEAGDRAVALLATVALDDRPGLDVVLALPVAPPRLERVAPPAACHSASGRGGVVTEAGGDVWRPADPAPAPGGLRIELAPASVLVRNAAIARLRPYLYTPNAAAALGCAALAALTVALLPR